MRRGEHGHRSTTMANVNGRRRLTTESWPNPPTTSSTDPHATQMLLEFGNKRGVVGRNLCILLGLLERDYLLSLPVPEGALGFEDLGVVTNRQLRWVFRKHLATLLGWTYRREEGDPDGIPAELNGILRSRVYPGA